MITGDTFQYGLPCLIPSLLDDELSVEQTGLLTCSPAHLLTCSPAHLLTCSPAHLLTWEAAADRWGERAVVTTGLGLGGLVLLAG